VEPVKNQYKNQSNTDGEKSIQDIYTVTVYFNYTDTIKAENACLACSNIKYNIFIGSD
jgi:hypothetical protein